MKTEPILLSEIMDIRRPNEYKLHLAITNNDGIRPLDEYLAGKGKWEAWNEYRGQKNDWNRPFIFSFVQFHPIRNAHLFAGVFEVIKRLPDRYELSEVSQFKKWGGRLICLFPRPKWLRGRAFNLESRIDHLEVHQLLPRRYVGE